MLSNGDNPMRIIRLVDIGELAELVTELLKRGVAFTAAKKGDGYWHVELTGY